MRLRTTLSTICTALTLSLAAGTFADVANAACTRLAFSVNDYGKDGPTKDAKDNLDKYIAKWTAERGIKKYVTGKKDVSCELFLDVGLFDEHTCKAAASVCWEGALPAGVTANAVQAGTKPKSVAPKAAAAKSAAKPVAAPTTTGSISTSVVAPAPITAPVVPAPAVVPTMPVPAPTMVPAGEVAKPQ